MSDTSPIKIIADFTWYYMYSMNNSYHLVLTEFRIYNLQMIIYI